jgi:hemolysin D
MKMDASKKDRKAKWGSQEREFLPAALEIVETPANPVGRVLAVSLSLFFTIALIWAFIGNVDQVAVATGKIIATDGIKQIQAMEIGKVRAIHVKDGDFVKKGSLLIELDPTESEVDKEQVLRQKQIAEVNIMRWQAYLNAIEDKPFEINFSAEMDDLTKSIAEEQLKTDLSAYQSQIARIDAECASRKSAHAAIKSEQEKLSKTLPLIVDRENALSVLMKDGVSSKPQWLETKEQLIQNQYNLNIQNYRLNEAQSDIEALEKEKSRIMAQERQRVLKELFEERDKFKSAVLTLRKAEKRELQSKLNSPVDGFVQQMNIHTVGGVVSPAEPIMLITPINAPLEIQAQVLNKDIGFVEMGQDVIIKIDSFPFTKYGTVGGSVRNLSRDAIIDENLGLVFDARVAMDKTEIFANEKLVKLQPGMTAMIEIKTGKRKIIDFILSPIIKYQSEALRER